MSLGGVKSILHSINRKLDGINAVIFLKEGILSHIKKH